MPGGGTIISPLIWECTRFCLKRKAESRVAAALMLGGGEIMSGFGVAHFAGVFDARMVRIYRLIGSSPEILGPRVRAVIRYPLACGNSPLMRRPGWRQKRVCRWPCPVYGSNVPSERQNRLIWRGRAEAHVLIWHLARPACRVAPCPRTRFNIPMIRPLHMTA